VVPPHLNDSLFRIMQHDLRLFFAGYRASVELRRVRCLALVRTDSLDKLRSAGGEPGSSFGALGCRLRNFPLGRLASELDVVLMQGSPLPIIDATGYAAPVDLEINADMSDREALNAELARYGLRLEEGLHDIPVLLIRDAKEAVTLAKP